jgi:hypothetical protein
MAFSAGPENAKKSWFSGTASAYSVTLVMHGVPLRVDYTEIQALATVSIISSC